MADMSDNLPDKLFECAAEIIVLERGGNALVHIQVAAVDQTDLCFSEHPSEEALCTSPRAFFSTKAILLYLPIPSPTALSSPSPSSSSLSTVFSSLRYRFPSDFTPKVL